MKEFMLIFVGADYTSLQLSPEEIQGQMDKWYAWVDKLRKQEQYIEGRPLHPGGKSIRGENPVITDGPFAEINELVGGYFIVKAKDMEEATSLAMDFPDYSLGGGVEVREVVVYS